MRGLILWSLIFPVQQAMATRMAGDDLARYVSEAPPPAFARMGEVRSSSVAPPLLTPVDWAQPPLGCVEEMVPHPADRACLDLSQVANPLRDWPSDIAQGDKDYWYARRRGLVYCRGQELLRREAAQPGSQTAGAIETAWMLTEAVKNYDTKVAAVYEAAQLFKVPLHVLTGAVYQESLFAELGIADDGGNFSCGVEQINLSGWCQWANKQSSTEKRAMGWPTSGLSCGDSSVIDLSLLKPFYRIALTQLNGLPEYRLDKSHFQNITLNDVVGDWPAADTSTNKLRYKVIRSFIDNCSDPRRGILAKANELLSIYNNYLSDAFKKKDRYGRGESFTRQCQMQASDTAYPLHTGWLMAVASYNAGPRAIDAVTYYNQWDSGDFNNAGMIAGFTPDKIVESIYWGGRYNMTKDRIDFASRTGGARSWIWFKGCVAQRHIARVMQHVTLLPEFFVDSLEGMYPCAKSTVDGNGNVVTSVPPARQASSGVKP